MYTYIFLIQQQKNMCLASIDMRNLDRNFMNL